MADGDYERGRGREIAAIAARLKRLAAERDGRKAVLSSVSGASRPGVLVLNGWASSPHAWDLCGFLSRPGVHLFSYVDQLAGQPERLLDSSAGRFVIVGWSMGGSGALRLACRFPDRVAGLVLVAATPRMMAANNWAGMSERRIKAFEGAVKITHGESFFKLPPGKPNPYRTDTDENLARGIVYLRETDLRLELIDLLASGKATFPVKVFQSERDGIVRPENATFLKAVFPQAEVTMVPGSEHALPIEIPEEIDAAVAELLG